MLWERNRTGLQGRLSSAMQRYRVSTAALLLCLPLSLSADTLLLPYTLYQDAAAKRPASDRNRH